MQTMGQEFDALKLLRQEQADNRSQFAQQQVKAQRLRIKRQQPYTFVGRDADSGNAVIAQNGQVVNAGEITSNALIKPGQSVRVLLAPGKATVRQLPKQLEQPKRFERSVRIGRIKWLTMIQKGDALEFYLCGTRPIPKKIYTMHKFRETLTLTVPDAENTEFIGFRTAYHRLDLSPYNFVFDGVLSNLGANEDDWLYTFGHSECLSYSNPPGEILQLIRRNRFYKLNSQGLRVFFEETVTYGDSPGVGEYPARTVDYFNAGNGFFSRREMTNDYTTEILNHVGHDHTLSRYSYVSDQMITAHTTEVDGVVTYTASGSGVDDLGEVIVGSINFTPKLKPAVTAKPTYTLIPGYFFNYTMFVWQGTDYFPAFQINRQGTAALAFGRYVREQQLWTTEFLCSAMGVLQAPRSHDSIDRLNYGIGFAVARTTGADPRMLIFDRVDSVLKHNLARIKDHYGWQVGGTGSYLNRGDLPLNNRFASKATSKVAEIELYDFSWRLQRTIKVRYYVHKPFQLKNKDRILQITNVSYHD